MKTTIKDLSDRYFAGETTAEEEKMLRRYFAEEDNLPPGLQELAPIFRFMEDEAAALAVLDEIRREETTPARRIKRLRTSFLWTIAAVAASLVIGIVLLNAPEQNNNTYVENCVWINGKRITDVDVVRQYAEKSFGKVKTEENLLEEQLNFMFEE